MGFEKGLLLCNQMAPEGECSCLLALERRLRLSGTAGVLNPWL
jgi:hypothetical protein